jgi:hypothetical protein
VRKATVCDEKWERDGWMGNRKENLPKLKGKKGKRKEK